MFSLKNMGSALVNAIRNVSSRMGGRHIQWIGLPVTACCAEADDAIGEPVDGGAGPGHHGDGVVQLVEFSPRPG